MKSVHILAVVMFIGNISTGVFWKAHADKTRDPRIIAHIMSGIIKSDQYFTGPGVFLIILGGVSTAMIGDYPILGTSWILWSIVLFTIAGIAFMGFIAPLQRRMLALARAANDTNDFDWSAYNDLSRRWNIWGLIGLVTPLAALLLMVMKPMLVHI